MTWFGLMKEDEGCKRARHKFHQMLIMYQPTATEDNREGILWMYEAIEKTPCHELRKLMNMLIDEDFLGWRPLLKPILDEWEASE